MISLFDINKNDALENVILEMGVEWYNKQVVLANDLYGEGEKGFDLTREEFVDMRVKYAYLNYKHHEAMREGLL